MQSLDEQLQAVDARTLTELVGKALNDPAVTVVDWSYTKINFDGVPVTAGVYRFSGTAYSQAQPQHWSLVLKVLHWVDLSDELGRDYLGDPIHFLYWKREALVFQSGILRDWEGGLVPVQCYGVSEPTPDLAWLWLEDLPETPDMLWNLDRHILAARHFGEFNGAHVGKKLADGFPWLNQNFIGQYLPTLTLWLGIEDTVRNPTCWAHPAVKRAFPLPVVERILRALESSDKIVSKLGTQPQTLSHQDTDRRNLFAKRRAGGQAQTVAIDWGFMGLAAVGEDLGNQIFGNLFHLEVAASEAQPYQEAAFEAYLEGLHDAGWQGNLEEVRLACAAQALTYIIFVPWILDTFVKEARLPPWATHSAQVRGYSAEETLAHWGEAIYFILDVAETAGQLAD
jgi:hypothetical protein